MVSIVITTKNAEEFIADCIKSVINSNYIKAGGNFEIILVDDYFKKWGFDETTKKQFGFYYRYIGVFIENGKWKKLFAHPLLSLSMYFLLFLRGCVYILAKFNISKKESVYEKK